MSDVTFWLTPTPYGAMQKVRHSPRGVGQKGDQVWQGGGGSVKKSDVTHPKNFISNFSSYLFLWCLSDTCFTQFLFIPPVFDENNVNYWTKLSHGNDYLLSIFEVSVCHFWVSDMGGGGGRGKIWQSVTRGRGSKNSDFRSDVLFELPHTYCYCTKRICSETEDEKSVEKHFCQCRRSFFWRSCHDAK